MPAPPEHPEADRNSGGDEMVEVAYAKDAIEAEMIHGLLENAGIPSVARPAAMTVQGPELGYGPLVGGFGGGPQRVMAFASQAEEARTLLSDTLVEDEEGAWPEIANARNLEDAGGHRPRGYGLLGAYARIYLWSLAAIAVFAAAWLLLRAV
jgi:putative signal transducing protein